MWTVLAISVGMIAVRAATSWIVAGPFHSSVDWPDQPSIPAIVRQTLAPSLVELALWLVVITALGWRRAVGFRHGTLTPVGFVAIAVASAVLVIGVADGPIAVPGIGAAGTALVAFVVAALCEEVAFRGFVLHGVSCKLGVPTGVMVSSLFFALAHVPWMIGRGPSALPLLAVLFADGVFYCWIRISTGTLWYVTTFHALSNLLTLIYGYWGASSLLGHDAFVAVKLVTPILGVLWWTALAGGWSIRFTRGAVVPETPARSHPEPDP